MSTAPAQSLDAATLHDQVKYLTDLMTADWVEECWIADNPEKPAPCQALKAWQAAIGAFRTVYPPEQVIDLERRAMRKAINRLARKDRKRILERHPNVALVVRDAPAQLELAA